MRCSDCMSDVCASDLTNCPKQYGGAHAAGRQVERTDQGGVDHDEPAAWIVVRRGPFGPSPSSQQTAEPEAPRTKRLRPAELDKLVVEQRQVGARQQGIVGTAFNPHAIVRKPDIHAVAVIPQGRRSEERRVGKGWGSRGTYRG